MSSVTLGLWGLGSVSYYIGEMREWECAGVREQLPCSSLPGGSNGLEISSSGRANNNGYI